MRKSLIALVVVLLVGAGVLVSVANKPWGLDFSQFGVGSGDAAWLAARSVDFLEDLKFKDFEKASKYHLAKAREARDVPALIQRAFGIKHEILDITSFDVLDVDLDRSGRRARVRTLVRFHVLGERSMRDDPGSNRDIEMLLYWFKAEDGSWTMELESSLR